MSIQHAIDFITTAQMDADFRKTLYRCSTQEELQALLRSQDLVFTEDEFQDAVNHLLLRCATESQAYSVHEMKHWFMLVGRSKP